MSPARELLRNRPFRLLWSVHVAASAGDGAIALALLLAAHRLTGSAAAVAGVAVALALPQALLGLPAGVLVDRWDLRRVLIVSDLVRAGFVLALLAAVRVESLWLLYALAAAQATSGAFLHPARGALLPDLVPAGHLLRANSLSEAGRVVAGVAGVAAAGAAAGLAGGLGSVLAAGAGAFLVSACLAARLPRPAAAASRERPPERIRDGLVEGLRLVAGSRVLAGVILAATVLMFGLGAVNVLLVPFVVDVLSASEAWFGALRAGQVVSMVLAGALLAVAAPRLRPPAVVSGGLVGIGLVVAAIGAATRPWHLLLLLFAVGWLLAPVQASVTTILQTEVPPRSRGRAQASFGTAVSVAGIVSMALAGAAAEALGVRLVFAGAGAIAVVAGVASAAVFRSTPSSQRKELECPATRPASPTSGIAG